jgi:hypothetical protein
VAVQLFVLGDDKSAFAEMPFGADCGFVRPVEDIQIFNYAPKEYSAIATSGFLALVREQLKLPFVVLFGLTATQDQDSWEVSLSDLFNNRVATLNISGVNTDMRYDGWRSAMVLKAVFYCMASRDHVKQHRDSLLVYSGAGCPAEEYESALHLGERFGGLFGGDCGNFGRFYKADIDDNQDQSGQSENDRCGSANAVGVKGNDSAPSATDDVDDRDLRVGASFFITIFLLLVVAGVYWCLLARLADPNLRKSANPETKESDKGASKN